jgi:hypothetical protein
MTPADPDESLLQHSSPVPQPDKPVYATEQQLKARAEAGASIEVSSVHIADMETDMRCVSLDILSA